ncbi:PadR family transcriptional regulator [Pseudosporangium ferrugineum]|nr:PadR family transcriptional regulator [Pseudosporangium ferrugineum]
MARPVRITGPLLDVLEVLLRGFADGEELHGWKIIKATKRSGPTVYGTIDRLEDAGWIIGRWEQENPEPHRPRRRLYRLTPNGVVESRRILEARRPDAARSQPKLAWRTAMPASLWRD